VKEVGLRASR